MHKRKFIAITMLSILTASLFMAVTTRIIVSASNTIYIKADGTVDPPAAKISNMGNNLYVLTGNISDQIIVERDNAIIDGAGFTLLNPEALTLEEYFDQNPPSSDPLVKFTDKELLPSVGIRLSQASYVTIKNLNIRGFSTSILIESDSNNNLIFQNDFKTTKYPSWIRATFVGLSLESSSDNRIYANDFSWFDIPVSLKASSRNTIYQNTMLNYSIGVKLYESTNNLINQNVMSVEDSAEGITLENSSFNIVSANDISSWFVGLSVSGDNNTFFENTIRWFGYPVVIFLNSGSYSRNNLFYHNNFLEITPPKSPGLKAAEQKIVSMNYFDNGYPSGGNYWSDFAGVDQFSGASQDQAGSDGILDSPALVKTDTFDNYPFAQADGWISSSQVVVPVGGGQDEVSMQSNAIISDVVATKNSIHCTVSGPSGQTAFVSIAVPMSANTTSLKVFVNNTKLTPPPFPIISANGTHYLVYFELSLSTHNVEIEYAYSDWFTIVVELLPYIVLVVMAVIIISLVVLYKRKKR